MSNIQTCKFQIMSNNTQVKLFLNKINFLMEICKIRYYKILKWNMHYKTYLHSKTGWISKRNILVIGQNDRRTGQQISYASKADKRQKAAKHCHCSGRKCSAYTIS